MIAVQVAVVIAQIEQSMKGHDLWEAAPPSPDALASTEPFCIDTLEFHQWTQWVLIPRMRALLEAQAALPTGAQISPMAEEALKENRAAAAKLIPLFKSLDNLLS